MAIVGAGHNGLACAAYLARAGRRVVVLERRSEPGGVAATEEIAPGYRTSATFGSLETVHPAVVRELGLAGHGLRLSEPRGVLLPAREGGGVFFPPDGLPEALGSGGVEPGDAEAFGELDRFVRRLSTAFSGVLSRPLPELEPQHLRGWLDLLVPAVRLRRLGAKGFAEALRFLPMPIADVAEERLVGRRLQAALAAEGVAASCLGPRSPGSALNLLLRRSGFARGALAYPRFARGGAGALGSALLAAARAAGAEVRTAAEVARIRIVEQRATGVVLADGQEVDAGTVVSNADPRTTFLRLVGARWLEPELLRRVRAIRNRASVALVHYALDGLPRLDGVGDPERLAGRILLAESVDEIERAFDDGKHGRIPERPLVELTIPTLTDPELAPEGHHVLSAWVQRAPAIDSWEEGDRRRLEQRVEERVAALAPSFPRSIVARRVFSPKDLEDRFGIAGGCLDHVEPALDQALYLRPLPLWRRFQPPIEGLQLCGAGTHGGLGLSCLPGRNAARRLLQGRGL